MDPDSGSDGCGSDIDDAGGRAHDGRTFWSGGQSLHDGLRPRRWLAARFRHDDFACRFHVRGFRTCTGRSPPDPRFMMFTLQVRLALRAGYSASPCTFPFWPVPASPDTFLSSIRAW